MNAEKLWINRYSATYFRPFIMLDAALTQTQITSFSKFYDLSQLAESYKPIT